VKPQRFVYLDTSAYLAVLLGEKSGREIKNLIEKKPLCSSVFLFLEAERNLIRLSREKYLSSDDFSKCLVRIREDVNIFAVRELDLEVCQLSSFPAVKTPRSADLVHLRTAVWFKDRDMLDGFLTLDKDQKHSAREMSLPILE